MTTRIRALIVAVVVLIVAATTVAVTRHDDSRPKVASDGPKPVLSSSASCRAWDEGVGAAALPGGSAEPVGADDGGDVGVASNGLHYFVRHNERPGVNAELRLVVNAGSSLEDADQSGAAHFLEHMLFNGTEAFPKNELVKTLQSLGVQIGADLNASTDYDETVYSLSVNASDDKAVSTALDVLYQWAAKATIDPADVESERGVILQEERLREESSSGRAQRRETNLLLNSSPYAGKEPIGTVDSIKSLTAEQLRRFYTDWYRSDLMAVVAVGDFDVKSMEKEIRKRFEQIPSASTSARPRPVLAIAPAPTSRIITFDDKETTVAQAEVLFPAAIPAESTTGDVRARVARDLAITALRNRLADDAARGLVPYYLAEQQEDRRVRPLDTHGLVVIAEPDKLHDALGSLLSEIARARRTGFTDTEVKRAAAAARRQADQDLADVSTRQDRRWASAYAAAFLTAIPTFDADSEHDAIVEALDALTAPDVTTTLRTMSACSELAVLATGPDSFSGTVPMADEVDAAIGAAGATDPTARAADRPVPTELMDRPTAAAPTSKKDVHIYQSATELTYANGARVIINPTPVQHDGFAFEALSPGGLSVVADADVANARYSTALVDDSGVADYDAVQLSTALSGHVVDLHSTIDDATEGFTGSASTADLETLLQLVHLRMSKPRVDNGALAAVLGPSRVIAAEPNREPEAARIAALAHLQFGTASRERRIPTPEDLAAIDPDKALAAYKARYGDASDFVFVLTGTFDVKKAIALAGSYLGTLPGSGHVETWQDVRPPPPKMPAASVVKSGHGAQGSVTIVYDVAHPSDPATRAHAEVLGLLLRERLFDRIREALGATYSPQVSVDVRDRPNEGIETAIEIHLDASRIDEVIKEIDGVVAGLATSGPADNELKAALTQLVRSASYYSNSSLAHTWAIQLSRPGGGDPGDNDEHFDALKATSHADVTALAAQIWPADHRLEVRVLPVGPS